jgi:hypothetical protein
MKQLFILACLLSLVISCHKPDQGNLNIDIFAPTAFLPDDANGNSNSQAYCTDGSPNCNKIFRMKISNPAGVPLHCELQIIDKDGIGQYVGNNIHEGWNGKKHNTGVLAPQGTYFYQFKATNSNTGDFKIKKGEFVLLR